MTGRRFAVAGLWGSMGLIPGHSRAALGGLELGAQVGVLLLELGDVLVIA